MLSKLQCTPVCTQVWGRAGERAGLISRAGHLSAAAGGPGEYLEGQVPTLCRALADAQPRAR